MSRKIKRTPLSALSVKAAFEEFVIAQTSKSLAVPTIQNYHSHFKSISKHIDIDTLFSELVQADQIRFQFTTLYNAVFSRIGLEIFL